jgi:hypothetical protein
MKAMTCLSDAWYVYWTSLCRTWKVQGFVYIRIGFDNHLDGLPGARLRLQVAESSIYPAHEHCSFAFVELGH